MRNLASVQKIKAIRPIVGADSIEAADVLGWTVVVRKGEFQPDQLVVYFEIDSWLDSTNPAFETFKDRFVNWDGKQGMRLKTIKLRKQISQGLILGVDSFAELKGKTLKEGDDLTEVLKIEKWESAVERQSNGQNKTNSVNRPFPSFIPKTDQERIQNIAEKVHAMADDTLFEVTVKLDGSSMTVYALLKGTPEYENYFERKRERELKKLGYFGKLWYKIKEKIKPEARPDVISGLCSRNIELDKNDSNHFSAFCRENDVFRTVENQARLAGQNLAVQGELIAPFIQENYEKVDAPKFFVYDIYNISKSTYLQPDVVLDISLLQVVPAAFDKRFTRLADFKGETAAETLKKLLEAAEGASINPAVQREGVVFKELDFADNSNFSFKVVSNSYLLKKG